MHTSTVYALIIGIDLYAPEGKLAPLRGCVNDARAVDAWLRLQQPDAKVTLLLNEQATLAAVSTALQTLAQQATETDVVWVHFSGHGSSMRSQDAANSAGTDESLVLWESRTSGGRDLRDKEFGALLAGIAARGAQVCAVLDCCHAAGQTRAEAAAIRACPADTRALPPDPHAAAAAAAATPNDTDQALDAVTILSACRDDEKAAELLPSELLPGPSLPAGASPQWHGAATWFLLRALEAYAPGMTWTQLHERVNAGVRGRYVRQTPQLAGPGDRLLFGGAGAGEQAALLVLAERVAEGKHQVQVNGGAALGVEPGARLALYPPAGSLAGPPVAGATVEDAETSTAWATVTDALETTLPAGARALISARAYGTPRLKIAIADAALAARLTAAGEALFEIADTGAADVTIVRQGEQFHCVDGAGTSLLPRDFGADAAGTAALRAALKQVAIYRNVQRLSNRAQQPALANVLAVAPPLALAPSRSALASFGQASPLKRTGSDWQAQNGQRVGLVVANRGRNKLLVRVLALQPDWSIVAVEPKGTGQTTVASGATLLIEHKPILPAGLAVGNVLYKIFVTTDPVDFESLLLPPLLAEPLKSATRNRSSLGWLLDSLRRTGTRPIRPADAAHADDKWFVSDLALRVA